ncbi:uncharacterized protein LOC119770611 [Culex quinquefasciatus]|uniref:uncharacterized protein LOC119770611 n=1 Tax=Culex quinquefasciatus TaxID=7176 RepID=UPI0018E34B60|nr:uncharacterized protein LOC119770611 [Culex quinquefasciatus]
MRALLLFATDIPEDRPFPVNSSRKSSTCRTSFCPRGHQEQNMRALLLFATDIPEDRPFPVNSSRKSYACRASFYPRTGQKGLVGFVAVEGAGGSSISGPDPQKIVQAWNIVLSPRPSRTEHTRAPLVCRGQSGGSSISGELVQEILRMPSFVLSQNRSRRARRVRCCRRSRRIVHFRS